MTWLDLIWPFSRAGYRRVVLRGSNITLSVNLSWRLWPVFTSLGLPVYPERKLVNFKRQYHTRWTVVLFVLSSCITTEYSFDAHVLVACLTIAAILRPVGQSSMSQRWALRSWNAKWWPTDGGAAEVARRAASRVRRRYFTSSCWSCHW